MFSQDFAVGGHRGCAPATRFPASCCPTMTCCPSITCTCSTDSIAVHLYISVYPGHSAPCSPSGRRSICHKTILKKQVDHILSCTSWQLTLGPRSRAIYQVLPPHPCTGGMQFADTADTRHEHVRAGVARTCWPSPASPPSSSAQAGARTQLAPSCMQQSTTRCTLWSSTCRHALSQSFERACAWWLRVGRDREADLIYVSWAQFPDACQ